MRIMKRPFTVPCVLRHFMRKFIFDGTSMKLTWNRKFISAANAITSRPTKAISTDIWKSYIVMMDKLVKQDAHSLVISVAVITVQSKSLIWWSTSAVGTMRLVWRTFLVRCVQPVFTKHKTLKSTSTKFTVKEKTYSCSKCQYKSSRQRDMDKHSNTQHCGYQRGDDPIPAPPAPESCSKKMHIERSNHVKSTHVPGFEQIAWPGGTKLVDDDDSEADPDNIFQCHLCDYIAQDKHEAWEHSKAHKAPYASSD